MWSYETPGLWIEPRTLEQRRMDALWVAARKRVERNRMRKEEAARREARLEAIATAAVRRRECAARDRDRLKRLGRARYDPDTRQVLEAAAVQVELCDWIAAHGYTDRDAFALVIGQRGIEE